MLCEKIQGTLEDFPDKTVDYVDVEWYEVFKKLHKKLSHHGVEIGIRLDNGVLTHGLWQDDVLGVEGGYCLCGEYSSLRGVGGAGGYPSSTHGRKGLL